MKNMNQSDILKIAMQQSAIDCSCRAVDFLSDKNVVVESFPAGAARRYLKLPHICDIVSYGSNAVVSCKKELIHDLEKFVNTTPLFACFETPAIYKLNSILGPFDAKVCFMAEYFLPDIEKIFATELPCQFETRILRKEDFSELYLPQWSNALCKDRKHLDVLAVGAYDGGRLIGLAGCSADCDSMWQIGIDVLPEYRNRGIGSALTNQLAGATFEAGKVPFYCAAWSNLGSVRTAIRSGFVPGWVEVSAKSSEFIENMNKKEA